MVIAELIASSSQILLKKSAQKHYSSVIREYLNVLVIAGYGMLVISMLLCIICYGGLPYMGVVVMEPLGYIIVMFLGRFVFKDKIYCWFILKLHFKFGTTTSIRLIAILHVKNFSFKDTILITHLWFIPTNQPTLPPIIWLLKAVCDLL